MRYNAAMIRFSPTLVLHVGSALALLALCACAAHAAPPPMVKVPPADSSSSHGGRHAFTVDDMVAMDRLRDLDVSPDGKHVVYTISSVDLAANKSRSDVWLGAVDGSIVRRLTSHPEADGSARFAPDGKSVLFISSRSGSSQVWRIPLDGGEASQVTTLPVDVDGVVPFPDGKRLLLLLEVYPDAATLEETAKRDAAKAKETSKVMAFDDLMIRHWDAWRDGKRRHVFVWRDASTAPVDLTKDVAYDAPPRPFGGAEQIAISPSGDDVVFAAKTSAREAAWSTNVDLFTGPSDGATKPVNLTAQKPPEDGHPTLSPPGSKLAYLAMTRPGYESDRRRVVVMDWKTKRAQVKTESWDRSPEELAWSSDGRTIFTT